MRLVSVEQLFGGTKTLSYFLADGRVDFRALVRYLAQVVPRSVERADAWALPEP